MASTATGVTQLPLASLPLEEIGELLLPYSGERLSTERLGLFQTYLALILKWNAKFNLTALRDPVQIVTRHFGEGVFAARFVTAKARTLMDLGSGVGIPGIPLQIVHPNLAISLVESQQKRASFLREAVRHLALASTVVAGRAEEINAQFDVVAMRAVEKMDEMLPVAADCLKSAGTLLVLTTHTAPTNKLPEIVWSEYPLPGAIHSVLRVGVKLVDVPRGTSSS